MSFFIPVKPNNPAALSNSQAIITAMEDIMKKKKKLLLGRNILLCREPFKHVHTTAANYT